MPDENPPAEPVDEDEEDHGKAPSLEWAERAASHRRKAAGGDPGARTRTPEGRSTKPVVEG